MFSQEGIIFCIQVPGLTCQESDRSIAGGETTVTLTRYRQNCNFLFCVPSCHITRAIDISHSISIFQISLMKSYRTADESKVDIIFGNNPEICFENIFRYSR